MDVLQNILVFNHIQYSEANGCGNRVAAKGIEVIKLPGELFSDSRRGDDRGQWVSVTDRLAHGYDVRNHS